MDDAPRDLEIGTHTESHSSAPHQALTHLRTWLSQSLHGDDALLIFIALLLAFTSSIVLTACALDFDLDFTGQNGHATPYMVLGTAFTSFFGATFLTGRSGAYTGWTQRRAWLALSVALQALLTAGAGLLCIMRIFERLILLKVALVGLATGLQIATITPLNGSVRKASVAQFPVAVVDLCVDDDLWRRRNATRNTRAGLVIAVVGGFLIGVLLFQQGRRSIGPGIALLGCAAVEGVVVLGLLLILPFKMAEEKEEHDVENGKISPGAFSISVRKGGERRGIMNAFSDMKSQTQDKLCYC